MNKILSFLILSTMVLVACGKHAESEQVKMQNGTKGLIVHCNTLPEDQCVAQVCKNGGQIVKRNYSNMPDNFIVDCQ